MVPHPSLSRALQRTSRPALSLSLLPWIPDHHTLHMLPSAFARSLQAVEAILKTGGALPINLKFMFEGEEEVGSPHLGRLASHAAAVLACRAAWRLWRASRWTPGPAPQLRCSPPRRRGCLLTALTAPRPAPTHRFSAAHPDPPPPEPFLEEHKDLLSCDFVISADGSQVSPTQPGLTLGLRGAVALEVEVRALATDVHSGGWAGWQRQGVRGSRGCGTAGLCRPAAGLAWHGCIRLLLCPSSEQLKPSGCRGGPPPSTTHIHTHMHACMHAWVPAGCCALWRCRHGGRRGPEPGAGAGAAAGLHACAQRLGGCGGLL